MSVNTFGVDHALVVILTDKIKAGESWEDILKARYEAIAKMSNDEIASLYLVVRRMLQN